MELPPKYLKNPALRRRWWISLTDDWKTALNSGFFNKGENMYQPSDQELLNLASAPVLRLVGPRGEYPNLTFELKDLNGVRQLTNLKYLFITFHAIGSLKPLQKLEKLESLFINNNSITSLVGIEDMSLLSQLYCHSNQIESLEPARHLINLETIYCSNNRLENFAGISEIHQKLSHFHCLPNKEVLNQEIKRIHNCGIICLKG